MQLAKHDLIPDEQWPVLDNGANISDRMVNQLIGVSRWALETRESITAHAKHENPVLLEGEPGTGKEFVARLIHACSARGRGPFVSLACDGMSEASVEASLFGVISGLTSGRNRIQRGMIEAANGGTLYVRGMAKVSSMVAAKVTRLIQYQKFRRVDDEVLEAADVRVILGEDTGLTSGAEEGQPKKTVLGVRDIVRMAPLRWRKADLLLLSRQFLKEFCQQVGKEPRDMSRETVSLMRGHDWPGNVRELKQVIEDMVQQSAPPSLTSDLLPDYLQKRPTMREYELSPGGINLSEEIKQFEMSLVCAALERCHGVQAKAAELLGLKLTTLNAKIARLGIDPKTFKSTTAL